VRSVRHGGARKTKGVLIQAWRLVARGHSRNLLVNGDLLNECLSDVHSKDEMAARATISARTCNVAHINAYSEWQSFLATDTKRLLDFVKLDFL